MAAARPGLRRRRLSIGTMAEAEWVTRHMNETTVMIYEPFLTDLFEEPVVASDAAGILRMLTATRNTQYDERALTAAGGLGSEYIFEVHIHFPVPVSSGGGPDVVTKFRIIGSDMRPSENPVRIYSPVPDAAGELIRDMSLAEFVTFIQDYARGQLQRVFHRRTETLRALQQDIGGFPPDLLETLVLPYVDYRRRQ